MEIKAVKFRKDGFYSQPFAFCGEKVPDENSLAFTGKDICTYMEAFASLGCKQGKGYPDITLLEPIADAFGISVPELILYEKR